MPPVYRYQPGRRAEACYRRHDRLHRYRQIMNRKDLQLNWYRECLDRLELSLDRASLKIAAGVDTRRRDFMFGACVGLVVSWLVRLVA